MDHLFGLSHASLLYFHSIRDLYPFSNCSSLDLLNEIPFLSLWLFVQHFMNSFSCLSLFFLSFPFYWVKHISSLEEDDFIEHTRPSFSLMLLLLVHVAVHLWVTGVLSNVSFHYNCPAIHSLAECDITGKTVLPEFNWLSLSLSV